MRRNWTIRNVALLLCLVSVCPLGAREADFAKQAVKHARREYDHAQELLRKGDLPAALEHAQAARDADPQDVRYAAYVELLRQVRSTRDLSTAQKLSKSGDYKSATSILREALKDDPNNPDLARAARETALHTFDAQADAKPGTQLRLEPTPMEAEGAVLLLRDPQKKRDFHLRGNAGQVLTDFFREYGIALQVDPNVQQKPVRMDMTDGDYSAALGVLLKQAHAFIVPASATQAVAYNDTQEQRNNHEHLYVQSFDIREAGTPQDINEITNALRAVFNFKSIGQTAAGKLALRGTRAQLVEAAQFIQMAMAERPEVMLDINEIEISDSLMRQAGLQVPLQYQALNISSQLQSAGVSSLTDLQAQLAAGTLSQTALTTLGGLLMQVQNQGIVTFGGGRTQELVLIPGTTFSFADQKNHARILEHVSLRALAGTVATYHDGLRYPIVTTTFSTLINPAALSRLVGNQALTVPSPAVEYVDLGISLKVTPLIQNNRDVRLQFELKVQSLTGSANNLVPIIGNREFIGTMTLREGESALISGLIEQTDLKSNAGIPGLTTIGLTALGGSVNRNRQQNEILVTITPRAIRMPRRDAVAFPVE